MKMFFHEETSAARGYIKRYLLLFILRAEHPKIKRNTSFNGRLVVLKATVEMAERITVFQITSFMYTGLTAK
jgi:hypothetical protein